MKCAGSTLPPESLPITVLLEEISPNPWNPHGMTATEFAALKDSIRERGVIRPIVVVSMDVGDAQTPNPLTSYRIVDGEHLWRALCDLALAGECGSTVPVLVLGNNSEIPLADQMEAGQLINHGGRGSLEDTAKTGRMVEIMTRVRPLVDVARRTGQDLAYLETAQRRVAPQPRIVPPAIALSERHGQTVPLVFESNEDLANYLKLIKPIETFVDIAGEMGAGRRRVKAVLWALERAGDSL